MQPFPTFPSLRSSTTWIALFGFTLTGASLAIEPVNAARMAPQGYSTIASSDDDRGSGRVANQTVSPGLVSFRGSGRVQPEPKPPALGTLPDSTHYYRGSGRLG